MESLLSNQDPSRQLLDEVSKACKEVLHGNLPAVPLFDAEVYSRIEDLKKVPWIGQHASGLARGWIPILERSVSLVEAHLDQKRVSLWGTKQIKEKFGTLRWYGFPVDDKLFQAIRNVTQNTSEFSCIVCGKDADLELDHGWVLNLCEEHKQKRAKLSPQEFNKYIYT